jgi:hypothetical protein
MFHFTIRDALVYVTGFCIAIAAVAALPIQYLLFPVALNTAMFLLIGQRKTGIAFGSWFVGAWLIAAVARSLG